MRAGIDSLVYLITCILSTVCLAACGNSLHRRNANVGEQSRAAASRGITLILATNDLTAAGFALSVGAGGIAVGTLILFIHSLRLVPMTKFIRRIFFLSPLMLALNTLLLISSGIAVTYLGRQGTTSVEAFIGSTKLPESVIRAQAQAQGTHLDYWANNYVKFMVASPWPVIPFALASLFFAYRAYQVEKPSAQQHATSEQPYEHKNGNQIDRQISGNGSKPEVQHIA
ncbi:hypothetical protein V865_007894 [Kwoniella europaea PYCC6329]|uniref:Transmembrane protein n=1 Tax=Kwoniella europaea PYCC6329 TaxID=1423913 RepID=A0AAX4KTQ1_9TREE